jgi:hypothetical protein
MRDFFRIAALFAAVATALAATSCIEPIELTPDIAGDIIALEVEGQTRVPTVNVITRTVNIELGEGLDLGAVKVTAIELVETATCDIAVGSVLDLTSPLKVTVTTAMPYEWTITATNFFDPQKPLPNGGMEDWMETKSSFSGRHSNWFPYRTESEAFWGSGNTILGGDVAFPDADVRAGSTGVTSARLASKSATGVGLAAGNIFTGRFVRAVTSPSFGGVVEFGQPFNTRPRALKFWYKAAPGIVDKVKEGATVGPAIGDTDVYRVFIALVDKGFPHQIDTTRPETFVDWATDERVVAFGEMVSSESVAEWTEKTIELAYRADSAGRTPTHIVVVASANMYGDYFVGSTSSVLYVDDFQLVY